MYRALILGLLLLTSASSMAHSLEPARVKFIIYSNLYSPVVGFTAVNRYDTDESFMVDVYSDSSLSTIREAVDIIPKTFTLAKGGVKYVQIRVNDPTEDKLWVCSTLVPKVGTKLAFISRVCSKLTLIRR